MPFIANLLIPDIEGNHPLRAHSFAAAVAANIAGDATNQQTVTYLNNVLNIQGAPALTQPAINELAQIKTNFDAKTTVQKMTYFIKLSHYSVLLEEAELSNLTAAAFDNFLEIT